MTSLALPARARVRNLMLSTALLGLAACGADGISSSNGAAATNSSPAAAAPATAAVAPAAATSATSSSATASTAASPVSPGVVINPYTPPNQTGSGSGGGTTAPPSSNPPPNNPPSNPPTATAAVTLDWIPPTENSDNSALTDLAGYTVYYGTSPDQLTHSVKITNAGLSAYTIPELTSGTWYFAISAYSKAGVESTRTPALETRI